MPRSVPAPPGVLAELGRRIRAMRLEAGMKRSEVADEAGIARSYIGLIESGRRNLTVGGLISVSRVLDADPAELVRGLHEL